jgi:hypothetical protein
MNEEIETHYDYRLNLDELSDIVLALELRLEGLAVRRDRANQTSSQVANWQRKIDRVKSLLERLDK